MIELLNTDCIEYMKTCKDKQFDLAITDPPYGAGHSFIQGSGKCVDLYNGKEWNIAPTDEYFEQLMRVSKNQIIWGGNYFTILWKQPCRGFIFWNKIQPNENYADGEFAWTSFDRNAKYFEYCYSGNRYGYKGSVQGVGKKTNRIHPTQKPIALYDFILKNYWEKGQTILDTHLGSANIAVACHYADADLVGTEIDPETYAKAVKNYQMNTTQVKMQML